MLTFNRIKATSPSKLHSSSSTLDLFSLDQYSVEIGAIDNGLAFPLNHPNRFRSYPYGWVLMPIVRVPFSKESAQKFLPKLCSIEWWEETLEGLKSIFSLDSDFKIEQWLRQKALLRGQGMNLKEFFLDCTLDLQVSPFSLVQKRLLMVYDQEDLTENDSLIELEGEQNLVQEEELIGTAKRFLRNQQRDFTRARQRIEVELKRAFFSNC